MNNRIRILDAAVSSRIAAGEVVTSPASVVKELVENAIDAGSSAVTIEIRDGGREYIRITDNGSGIHPEDVLLSVKKHATSKIVDFEDMKHIASLGFRGEALASIAAVSNLTIKTRVPGEMEGRILTAGPDRQYEVKPAGLPDGTSVIVENLFYNVPARLKFLKRGAAEAAAISDLVCRLVLSRPELSFKYIVNDVLQLQSPGTGELMDAAVSVYGKTIRARIFEVLAGEGETQISGYVSNPNYLFKSAKNQTILVNGRYVKSAGISLALSRAYGERLMKGHFPFAVLNISLPLSDVDVNVHPNKTTVLIHNEDELLATLNGAVKNALTQASLPRFELDAQKETKQEYAPWAAVKAAEETGYKPEKSELRPAPDQALVQKNAVSYEASRAREETMAMELNEQAVSTEFEMFINEENEQQSKKAEEEQQKFTGMDELLDYRIVGQIFNTYIVAQSGDTAYIIDQHAAHERLNYERLKKMNTLLPQKLLFPYAMRLSHADHDITLKYSELLGTLGIELEDFGVNTLKITALPLQADQGEIEGFMEDVIDLLRHAATEDMQLFRDKIIRRACRTSIKAGDNLSNMEMEELMRELTVSKTVPICPHGRPVAVVLTKDELEKGFKRKV